MIHGRHDDANVKFESVSENFDLIGLFIGTLTLLT